MPAGKYRTGATFILGSTRLWQSVMERVSVSQAVEIYSRIGLSPCPRGAVDCPPTGICVRDPKAIAVSTNHPRANRRGRRNIFKTRVGIGLVKRRLVDFSRGP